LLQSQFFELQVIRAQLTSPPAATAAVTLPHAVAREIDGKLPLSGVHFLFTYPTPEGDEAVRCLLRLATRSPLENAVPSAAPATSAGFFVLADPHKEQRLVGVLGELGFVPGPPLSPSPADGQAESDLGRYQVYWSSPSF